MPRTSPVVLSAVLLGGHLGSYRRANQPRGGPGVIGRVSLEGISVLLGPNSAGKSTVLEMLEPAFQRSGTELYSDRRSYSDEEIWIQVADPRWRERTATLAQKPEVTEQEIAEFHERHADDVYWLGMWGAEDCALSAEPQEGEVLLDIGGLDGVAEALSLPIAVSAPTEDSDPDKVLTAAVDRFLRRQRQAWVTAPRDDTLELHPMVGELVDRLEQQLRGQVPAFLEADGPLRLVVQPLVDWDCQPGATGRIHLCTETPVGLLRLRDAGRGARRWGVIAARMAAARVEADLAREAADADEVEVTSNAPRHFLLLIDEPEAHLHQIAQADVRAWLVDQAHRDTSVVLATHSPQMLRLPSELTRYHDIRRADWRVHSRGETTEWLPPHPATAFSSVRDVSDELGGILRDDAEAMGYEDAVWVSASRALVFVEGRHDLLLLEHFYGRELRRLRLQPYALHGGKRSRAIAESDLVTSLGVRLLFVFDNVRAAAVADDLRPIGELSDEEKLTRNLLGLRDQGRNLTVVPYEDPDVICAVRPSVVARVLTPPRSTLEPLVSRDTWEPAVAAFRRSGSPNFKHWLLVDQLACGTSAERAIEKLIKRLRPSDTPTPAFTRMWHALTAAAEALPPMSPTDGPGDADD